MGRLERRMKNAIIAGACVAAITLGCAGTASAGVWQWGCIGPLDANRQIIFNRGALIVVPSKPPRGKLRDLIHIEDLSKDPVDGETAYNVDDINGGLQKGMTFTSQDSPTATLVLKEMSSTKTSHSDHLVCGRDEIIDTWRKVYRFDPPHERARDVKLQCMEYTLTTTGGRPCIYN
jgi:hypothetical protein